jgi:hypothetical protein
MTISETPQPGDWDDVHRTFLPFAGTCLYAIRAEVFFHLALRHTRPGWFRLKNAFYPAAAAWRSLRVSPLQRSTAGNRVLMVCDYAAEAGLGTLLPLLRSSTEPVTVVVTAQVLAARGRELARLGHVEPVCADAIAAGEGQKLRLFWERSKSDCLRLLKAAPPSLRTLLSASQLVVQTLLARSYFYESFLERRFAQDSLQAVVTHNDFTSLSYLAGEVARRQGIPDFTLQHGFPSQEYFPASASHYLVWGRAFEQAMKIHALNGTRFVATGAPRLDAIAVKKEKRSAAREKLLGLRLIAPQKLNLLFLSQGHSAAFSVEDHGKIINLIALLARQDWLQVLVRRHPQESGAPSSAHLAGAVIVPREISLVDAVLASDVVVSVNSTSMLEAALLQVPVLQLALPGFENRLGALRFPRQISGLASACTELQRLRDPKERDQCVCEQQELVHACVQDPGRGTENVWRYIREHSGILSQARAASCDE